MSVLSSNLLAVKRWLLEPTREPSDAAVGAIVRAVNATTAYIADAAERQERERATERQLIELWQSAALALRSEDPALARRLQIKAEYWANPARWTDADIARAEIYLDDITRIARRMVAQPRGRGS